MSRVMHIFFDVHMAQGHDGLSKMLKKETPVGLKNGETALFINRAFTACKLMTSGDIILHCRRPANMPLRPELIRSLPSYVKGSTLDYEGALADLVSKQYVKKYGDKAVQPRRIVRK